MSDLGKVEVKIKGSLGVAKPFPQGGVWRLTIPKRVVKEHNLNEKSGNYFAYVFINTDKGLLLVPLSDFVNPQTLRNALSFANLSHLSDEDLELLFQEDEV